MQTILDIPSPRCPSQSASYLHYLHVEHPSLKEPEPSWGARAPLVLEHLQAELVPAAPARWDGTHGLGSALLHLPHLLRVPHCGGRNKHHEKHHEKNPSLWFSRNEETPRWPRALWG